MRLWDSITRSSGPGAPAVIIGLAILLLVVPTAQRVEFAVLDLLQRAQPSDPSQEIVIVDTREWRQKTPNLWEHEHFAGLLEALGKAGARLIIPVEAPPLAAGLPDARQLAALADMERRRLGADAPDAGSGPWAEMARRSEVQARTVKAAQHLRNLIVPVPTYDSTPPASGVHSGCQKHVLAQPETDPGDRHGLRSVRSTAGTPDALCEAVLGAGHMDFWTDDDGVVRQLALLVDASGTLVKAAPLEAAWAMSFPTELPRISTTNKLAWDSRQIRTSTGMTINLQPYSDPPDQPLFERVPARLLLDGRATTAIAGKIVILGDRDTDGGRGYPTAGGERRSTALLIATALSNLLMDDYVVRPAWLGWAEKALFLPIAAAALMWGTLLPGSVAAMSALLAVSLLIGTEAYFISTGVWVQLAIPALFVVLALGATRLRHFYPQRRSPIVVATPDRASAGSAAAAMAGDDLDLAFSMLRHQPAGERVKKQLYDLALEHARRHDLARAERVLRHLAGIDPQYRRAGEKLTKLAGLRMSAPGAAPAPGSLAAPAGSAADAPGLSGRTLGRYHIEQAIGRGAMATVYLGRDPKINRRVAIKTIALAEEFSDSDLENARTQFLREAESAGRLNHPDIISIYDAGEDDQVAYLAMEYFSGKPLSYYTQQGRLLPPAVVLDIMARAAEALHYAHSQHVVHRDVKPANLLYDEATDTLKITDFGIARLTDTSRTKTGIILGTPSYMSPEQLAGTGVSGQSDLFSLGITLYQLLAGAPPFRADSIPRLMQKIAHEPHPPLRTVRDDLPPEVEQVLDRALAKNPADRFQSGRAMALALRDCCSSFNKSVRIQPG
jgi:serine/threonine-protein kinase